METLWEKEKMLVQKACFPGSTKGVVWEWVNETDVSVL